MIITKLTEKEYSMINYIRSSKKSIVNIFIIDSKLCYIPNCTYIFEHEIEIHDNLFG